MNYLQARSPSGVTNYYEMNGVLIGESGPNGTMYYHTDALGSVTMTTNSSGAVLNEYRYKPYGAQLSKTGTAPDPKFTWVGTQGYRQTALVHSDAYVRNRHYGSAEGRWTTATPLCWYPAVYAGASPTTLIAPVGLCGGSCGYAFSNPATDADPSGLIPRISHTSHPIPPFPPCTPAEAGVCDTVCRGSRWICIGWKTAPGDPTCICIHLGCWGCKVACAALCHHFHCGSGFCAITCAPFC
jgi:hypothetical protein